MSLPMPSGDMPVAIAAASPPLDPPGVRDGSQGFIVAPCRSLSVCQRKPKSGMLVRATTMAPAAFRWRMTGASRSAIECRRLTTPCVVAEPSTSMFSLTVMGRPWSGPTGSPDATRRSARSAAASASSANTAVTAFTAPLMASIRSRCACTTSRLDRVLSWMAFTKAEALQRQGSSDMMTFLVTTPSATGGRRRIRRGTIVHRGGVALRPSTRDTFPRPVRPAAGRRESAPRRSPR